MYFQRVPLSPFRLRRRISPRPVFLGVDAMVKVVGAAPFVEPERRFGTFDYFATRTLATSSLRFRRMNLKTPAGIQKLKRLLAAATPVEYRAAG